MNEREPAEVLDELLLQQRRLKFAVRRNATQMADMLIGELRTVTSGNVLTALKRELSDFNIHTGKWKRR